MNRQIPWHIAGSVASATKRLVASLTARGYDKESAFVKTQVLAKANVIMTKAQAKASAKVAADIATLRGGVRPVISLSWLHGIIGTGKKVSLVVVQRAAGVSRAETSVQLTPETKASMAARAAVARVKGRITAAVCKGMEIKGYIVSLSCRATRGLVGRIAEVMGDVAHLDFDSVINRGLSVFARFERTGVVAA